MSAPTTTVKLLELISKSGVVSERQLATYLQDHGPGCGLPDDPNQAAERFVQDGLLTRFQVEQLLLGKWKGFTIGKYRILERIGVGGMGQVFLCVHMLMHRRVAIKVLPPAKAEHPSALGRFYREARAAGSLEHANIVRTHDIDQDGNLHYIVMEYVDGSNLLDIVTRFGPLPITRAADYVRQAALGLDYANRNGIVHRDIKPGNILIDREGVARILDLGLARFYLDQGESLTAKYDNKIVLGTADYVAPEQILNSHNVDSRADIYALGATFYYLLAGHPAFPGGSVSQKLIWHRTKEPTPITNLRREVPRGLAAVLAKMMAKDPAQRYQAPAEVAAALEKWVRSEVPLPAEAEMPQHCPAVLSLQSAAGEGSAKEEEEVLALTHERPRIVFSGQKGVRSSSRVEVLLPRHPFVDILEPETQPSTPFGNDNTAPEYRPARASAVDFTRQKSAGQATAPWTTVALAGAAAVLTFAVALVYQLYLS